MIRVAGLDYCVRVSNNAGDFSSGDLNGETDFNECCISIRSDLNLKKQQQTFIHELTHVIIEGEETGRATKDERFVTRISNILYGILVDNKMLTDDWWESIVDEHPHWQNRPMMAANTRGRTRNIRSTKRRNR